jgi:hypothetical protein
MNHSLSLFVFDFAAGFDDFGVNAFYDFSADFKCLFDFDFGSSFDCFSNFEGSLVSSEIPDDESVGARSGDSGPLCQRRSIQRTNRAYHVESVTESAWFWYFTRPGMTRDLTHELSVSDRFGHFRHYFCMPLRKVEEVTDLLITRGYVPYPRTRCRQHEFRKRIELLVMSSLYLLGTVASFRACQPMCFIARRSANFIICFSMQSSTCVMSRYSCRGILGIWQRLRSVIMRSVYLVVVGHWMSFT